MIHFNDLLQQAGPFLKQGMVLPFFGVVGEQLMENPVVHRGLVLQLLQASGVMAQLFGIAAVEQRFQLLGMSNDAAVLFDGSAEAGFHFDTLLSER
jgi:hypothetical protein